MTNHRQEVNGASALPDVRDRLYPLEVSSDSDLILEFAERYTVLLAEFSKKARQVYQPSQKLNGSVRNWLVEKAQEYDSRLKPININPPLESRTNHELLDFIVMCESSEVKNSRS
jgi:hypothetical protein